MVAAPTLSATQAERTIHGDVRLASLGFNVVVADLLANAGDEIAFSALDVWSDDPNQPAYVGVLAGGAQRLADASPRWVEPRSLSNFGHYLSAVDMNGDGAVDLVVGTPMDQSGDGRIEVLWGPLVEAPEAAIPANAKLLDTDERLAEVGAHALLGDWDDDGHPEVALGARNGASAGEVLVFEIGGPIPFDPADAELIITGSTDPGSALDSFGAEVAAADVDADGRLDLLVGMYDAGEVYVYASASGASSFTDAMVVLTGEPGVGLGSGMAALGDIDGDGVRDFALPARMADVLPGIGPDGSATIALLPLEGGALDATGPTIVAENPSDTLGTRVISADLDGDGFHDLAIGAPGYEYSTQPGPGVVYVFKGPLVGTPTAPNADLALIGACDGEGFGFGLSAGDVDGDGLQDLAVGAPWNSEVAALAGAIYVFSGTQLRSAISAP